MLLASTLHLLILFEELSDLIADFQLCPDRLFLYISCLVHNHSRFLLYLIIELIRRDNQAAPVKSRQFLNVTDGEIAASGVLFHQLINHRKSLFFYFLLQRCSQHSLDLLCF